MQSFDLVVVGAGPGGYVAAIRAAQHGLKTALVERDSRLGGTCLLRGCIPTKSLLHSADLWQQVGHLAAAGIKVGPAELDFAGVQRARDQVVTQSARGVDYLMRKNKITVLKGHGRLVGAGRLQVAGEGQPVEVAAKHILIATGSRPRQVPGLAVDGTHLLTSDELLALPAPPASMLVLGGGAVGVEFASVFSRFGSQVTVVEMQPTLLPVEDTEVGQAFGQIFARRGVTCHTNTRLAGVERTAGGVKADLECGPKRWSVTVEKLLVAVGRAPVTEDLGLDQVGIALDAGGFVPVDTLMRTSAEGISAIGDVVRTPWLAHVASAEGTLVADRVAGRAVRPIDYLRTPSCTYASPEVASVGLTERAARERGGEVKTGKFPFSAVAKARIGGDTDGFVKFVADARYGEILGVHILGARATDLIAEACVALRGELTMEELADTMHAHPTYAEGVVEAAHATLGHALHI